MTSDNEVWKPIPGFINYEASNLGRIRNSLRGNTLVGTPTKKGYRQVNVRDARGRRTATIHRLVALAFLGLPPPRFCCHHVNAVKHDNRPENLTWVSIGDNVRLAHQMGLVPFDHMKGEKNVRARRIT